MLPDDPGQQRVFVLFAVAAVGALGWLWVRRASLRRRHLDVADRRLAFLLAAVVFYPATVLIHEWGHVAAVHLVGGNVLSINWNFIEGSVVWDEARGTTSTQVWFVAVAGSAAQLLSVLVLAALAWRVRRTPNLLRLAMMVAAAASCVQTLLLYPASAQDGGGDFGTIYGSESPLVLRVLTVVVHGGAILHMFHEGREHLDEVLRGTR